jgi:hypothetical protein
MRVPDAPIANFASNNTLTVAGPRVAGLEEKPGGKSEHSMSQSP